jgi:glycosyltransferase involved in cell wall biosynthesis
MQQARAIIIPSRFEGFGLCMPEAMFNGCLAIGRNTGGTKEQLDNGLRLQGSEIALRYDTTNELTHLLCEISQSPIAQYQPMVERAFHTVNQLYTEENNAREIFQFYQSILKTK